VAALHPFLREMLNSFIYPPEGSSELKTSATKAYGPRGLPS